jgi:hypothetical protein
MRLQVRLQGSFRATFFLPHNSLQSSTCPFSKTVVSIAARSRKIKTRACSGPAMRRDRQYDDLDGDLEWMDHIIWFISRKQINGQI